MAEIESNGRPIGGLPVPHAQEGQIRAQNAERVARRRQASALFQEVQRVEGSNLDRFGERRRVGGRFERLQEVPERKAPARQGLQLSDLAKFLQAFQFDAQSRVLGKNSFLSSFGPGVLGLNRRGNA